MFVGEAEVDDITEVVLCFISNITTLFSEVTLKIEGESTSAIEIYKLMNKLKTSLMQRQSDKFFGFLAMQKLEVFHDKHCKRKLENEFLQFYDSALAYMAKSFDFSDTSLLSILSPLALDNGFPDMSQLTAICKALCIDFADSMYDEFCDLRAFYVSPSLPASFHQSNVYEKWKVLLSKMTCPNVQKIVSLCLSLPSSNAGAERVFSAMNAKWTDVRNRAAPELIKAEIQVKHNFDHSCKEFYQWCLKDEQLLKLVKSTSKYDFK